jgi:hypothetical protein
MGFARSVDRGVDDSVAAGPDGLGEMTFPGSRRPKNKTSSRFAMKVAAPGIEDQPAIIFLLKQVEVFQRGMRIAKVRFLAPTFQQPITATSQFIGNEARDQIDRRHRFGLSLM